VSTVDKSSAGVGVRQFHIDVAPGEVSTVALLPGDPFRVPLVEEYVEGPREVAHKREHRTMIGSYKGRDVTVTSTGMGCPSTAIAVEELARVGVTSFIRVGSTAALQPGIEPGDPSSARAPSATTARPTCTSRRAIRRSQTRS
jgi:uridine phosphorylase